MKTSTAGRWTACAVSAVMLAAMLPAVPASAAATLTVGRNGDYKTVGEAVAAAAKLNPTGESSRVTIAIEPGTYREQLLINTPYLTFVNSNPAGGEVLLTWYYGIGYKYYSAASTGYYKASDAQAKSAKAVAQRWGTSVRLQKDARYFRAENITFENSFNRYVTDEELADGVECTYETIQVQRSKNLNAKAKSSTERAAAMCVEADYAEFLNCKFYSSQDTLYTANPAYFKNCLISGNTDYIFGSGDVVFDACELQFAGYSDNAVGGYITAARQQTKGYLFWECNVTAAAGMKVGSGFFGRPWRDTAHVLFYNTKLQYESIISGAGWTSMSGVDPSQATFREYNTKTANGGGVNTGSRTRGTVLSSCDATREQYFGNWTPYYYNNNGTSLKVGARLEGIARCYLRNANSGQYLTVTADNAVVQQPERSDAALILLEPIGNGYYLLYNSPQEGTYLALETAQGSSENGTAITANPQTGGDQQLLKFVSAGADKYEIVTQVSGDASCLGVSGASQDAGAAVVEWECNGSADQQWIVEPRYEAMQGRIIKDLIVYDREHVNDWSILPEARDGEAIFGDRDVTLTGLPALLREAEMIRTACNSKNYAGMQAEFTLNERATVYVGLDSRVPTPEWLSDWTQTSMTYQNSLGDVTFNVYKKNFWYDDLVQLGMNWDNSKCVNYTVFVTYLLMDGDGSSRSSATVTTTTTGTTTTTTQTSTTTQTTTTVTTTAETTQQMQPLMVGDLNCSGVVDINDAVMMARLVGNDITLQISDTGIRNADCDGDGRPTPADLTKLLRYLARLIPSLG